jgi:hypothetical protein
MIRRIFPSPERNSFVRLLVEWEPFVNALDRLPQRCTPYESDRTPY